MLLLWQQQPLLYLHQCVAIHKQLNSVWGDQRIHSNHMTSFDKMQRQHMLAQTVPSSISRMGFFIRHPNGPVPMQCMHT